MSDENSVIPDRLLAALTETYDGPYPAYINVYQTGVDECRVTLRERGRDGQRAASQKFLLSSLRKFAEEILEKTQPVEPTNGLPMKMYIDSEGSFEPYRYTYLSTWEKKPRRFIALDIPVLDCGWRLNTREIEDGFTHRDMTVDLIHVDPIKQSGAEERLAIAVDFVKLTPDALTDPQLIFDEACRALMRAVKAKFPDSEFRAVSYFWDSGLPKELMEFSKSLDVRFFA